MKKENQRRLFGNFTWEAGRYFMLLEFVIFMMAMLYLLYVIFGTVNGVADSMTEAEQAKLARTFDQINFLLLIRITIVFCIVFFINIILGLFFLHRLTGPLVRFKVLLNQLAEGSVPDADVILRKGDFPTDVAAALSSALRKIRQWRRQS
ncbi:MAG: hypothetical protein HY584_01635 [Candidatus Omnitrophica bacterium]|nr:hypothetical protein [Candidatus Omnitrophota bacterium]